MKAGFYRYFDGILFRAGKFVYAPTYTLLVADKDSYTYPTEGGWMWFETFEEALAHWSLPEDVEFME